MDEALGEPGSGVWRELCGKAWGGGGGGMGWEVFTRSPHLVNRQCCAGNGKYRLDVRCSEGLGYLPHRGVVLR